MCVSETVTCDPPCEYCNFAERVDDMSIDECEIQRLRFIAMNGGRGFETPVETETDKQAFVAEVNGENIVSVSCPYR